MKKKPSRISLRSLRRAGLPERVAGIIRQAIFDQRLKPNDRIREIGLSRELNVSRTPLREALRYLEQEGLVVRKPFRGTYVASMNEDEMRKVFRIRAVLESMTIQDARLRMQPADWAALQGYLKAMKFAVEKGNLSEFNRNDMALHKYIWKLSGDEVLERVLNQLCRQSLVAYNIQTLALLTHKELRDLLKTHHDFLALLKNNRVNLLKSVRVIQDRWLSKMTEKLFPKAGSS